MLQLLQRALSSRIEITTGGVGAAESGREAGMAMGGRESGGGGKTGETARECSWKPPH